MRAAALIDNKQGGEDSKNIWILVMIFTMFVPMISAVGGCFAGWMAHGCAKRRQRSVDVATQTVEVQENTSKEQREKVYISHSSMQKGRMPTTTSSLVLPSCGTSASALVTLLADDLRSLCRANSIMVWGTKAHMADRLATYYARALDRGGAQH